MRKYSAFLRGINVTGRNRVPMAELRAVCESLGWSNVETYIQSGNVVFSSGEKAPNLESMSEKAINSTFGLEISVIIRSAKEIAQILDTNPFPEASEKEPNLVLLGFSKLKIQSTFEMSIKPYAQNDEKVSLSNNCIYIHYAGGVGRSKITPLVLDKYAGSPVTSRNWRTMVQISAMLR